MCTLSDTFGVETIGEFLQKIDSFFRLQYNNIITHIQGAFKKFVE